MTLQATIFENNSITYTKSLYQHDKNVTLVFDGIDLPEKYEVHFSNYKDDRNISVSLIGTAKGVLIPDALLSTGHYVYVWVVDAGTETGKGTIYTVVIPVIPRPMPIPVQESTVPIITNYEIEADGENLSFTGILNDIMKDNIEEEP